MVKINNITKPLLSIIIPTYNRADFWLPRCLNAIERCSYTNIEIIVVNDGGNDETLEICQQFGAVHLYNPDGPSISHPNSLWTLFLMGFKEAKGKYLTWCASDDRVADHFNRSVDFLENDSSYSAVYGNFAYVTPDDQIIREVKAEPNYVPEHQRNLFCCNASMLFNRDWAISNNLMCEGVSELVERHIQLCAASRNLFHIDHISYYHTQHTEQITVQGGGSRLHPTGFHITTRREISAEEEEIYQQYQIGKRVEEYIEVANRNQRSYASGEKTK